MTTAPVPRIDISNLQLAAELGGGGQGKVTAVSGLLINGQWPAALKVYSGTAAQDLDTAALERAVAFPRQLSEDQGLWLEESTAWPSMIAEDRGVVCGFLMRTIPEAYYFGFRTPAGGSLRKPSETAFLLNSDSYVASSGLVVSDRDRLELLASVASALSSLHDLGVTVGDLSPKNLLFSLRPQASCFIIDCDAMRVRGETALKQIQTTDWEVPPGEETATPAADAYKFGLLAVRLFARDQSSYDRAPLAAVSPELGRLAGGSLDPDPSRRPGPRAWIPALTAAISTASAAAPAMNTPAAPPRISVPIETVPATGGRPAPSPPGPAPRRRGRRRAGALAGTVAGIAVVALVVIVGLHSTSSPAASSSAQTGSSSAQTGTAGTGTTAGTGGGSASQQAAQLNNLLDASAASRQSLATAVQDVGNCSNVSGAISAISTVAGQRASEYSQAAALSTGALPDGAELKSDLLSALHYSVAADRDFLKWAQQNTGCQTTVPPNRAYDKGLTASANAVTAKKTFLQLWNPIASSDGYPDRAEGGI